MRTQSICNSVRQNHDGLLDLGRLLLDLGGLLLDLGGLLDGRGLLLLLLGGRGRALLGGGVHLLLAGAGALRGGLGHDHDLLLFLGVLGDLGLGLLLLLLGRDLLLLLLGRRGGVGAGPRGRGGLVGDLGDFLVGLDLLGRLRGLHVVARGGGHLADERVDEVGADEVRGW